MEGKIVNLSKPLGVLVKKEVKGDPDSMHVDSNEEEGEGNLKVEYDMLAVVKRKILFSKRPMPMVNYSSTIDTIDKKL